jgi:GNAT superfamily N-acetyltransferase
MPQLQAADLEKKPHLLDQSIALRDGTTFLVRLHVASDTAALGRYFEGLSEATRRVYGPHPFTAEQAHIFCREIDYSHTLRLVAETATNEFAAYFILRLGVLDQDAQRYAEYGHPLSPDTDCSLAPSVADVYQERGLGSALFPVLTAAARRLGRQRIVLWGGVRADNPRAEHFYRKLGFVEYGQFEAGGRNNYSIILDL